MSPLNLHFTFIGTNFTLRGIDIQGFRELNYTYQIDFILTVRRKTYLQELQNPLQLLYTVTLGKCFLIVYEWENCSTNLRKHKTRSLHQDMENRRDRCKLKKRESQRYRRNFPAGSAMKFDIYGEFDVRCIHLSQSPQLRPTISS